MPGWYINKLDRTVPVFDDRRNVIAQLAPGQLHLHVRFTPEGWQEIYFWRPERRKWEPGWLDLEGATGSIPFWFHLYESGAFSTEARILSEKGKCVGSGGIVFYFEIEREAGVYDSRGLFVGSYRKGTVIGHYGYHQGLFLGGFRSALVSHAYVGLGGDLFVRFPQERFVHLGLEGPPSRYKFPVQI